MTGPREWRHAGDCDAKFGYGDPCFCVLSAVRDAIAAGHRVVIGPDGVEGRLEYDRLAIEAGYRVVPLEEP